MIEAYDAVCDRVSFNITSKFSYMEYSCGMALVIFHAGWSRATLLIFLLFFRNPSENHGVDKIGSGFRYSIIFSFGSYRQYH